MLPNEWKLPLNFAVGLHILVILAALYLPGLFKAKPKFAEIYTVSLTSVVEQPAASSAPAKQQTQAPPQPKKQETAPPQPPPPPPKPQKAVPIEEPKPKVEPTPQPTPQPAPPKAISLKPLKQKIVKQVKEPEPPPPPKKTEQDLQKVKKLAEALREEAILNEKAKLAQEALEQERKLLTQSSPGPRSSQTSDSSGPTTAGPPAGGSTTQAEALYYSQIAAKIQQYWTIPEYLTKDPSLKAVVGITIRSDGSVADVVFENKSGDRAFDQFVSKTIAEASPFPPIPPALKKQRLAVGVRFKPEGVQEKNN